MTVPKVVTKPLSIVAQEFQQQVLDTTDPTKPEKLKNYMEGYRTQIGQILHLLADDPCMAAFAMHGVVAFQDHRLMNGIVQRDAAVATDWPLVKKTLSVHPDAHKVVKLLEDQNLHEVLVAAMVANFVLEQSNRRAKRAKLEARL